MIIVAIIWPIPSTWIDGKLKLKNYKLDNKNYILYLLEVGQHNFINNNN